VSEAGFMMDNATLQLINEQLNKLGAVKEEIKI
jgi:hypothetical protein